MSDDGGMRRAVFERMLNMTSETSAIERPGLRTLVDCEFASAAWRALAEQANGRWKTPTRPSDVLNDVVASLILASAHKRLPKLQDEVVRRYDELSAAVVLLRRHLFKRGGPVNVDLMRPEDAGNEWAKNAIHLEFINELIFSDQMDELRAVNALPRPAAKGRGADARAFAQALSTLLDRRYGLPFSDFSLAMTATFFAEDAEAVDAESLARHRRRDAARRAKARGPGVEDVSHWADEDPFTKFDGFGKDMTASDQVVAGFEGA